MTLSVADSDLRGLVGGETIVALTNGDRPTPGTRLLLVGGEPRDPGDLKPAYRRWAGSPCPGRWKAEVVDVAPVSAFDADAFRARHLLDDPDAEWVVVLRVLGPEGPVLSDEAFRARVRSLEQARA
jgi:hypothetical protein